MFVCTVQDIAAERCTMPYRSPELFNVENGHRLDEKVDIWVSLVALKILFR